MSEDKTYNLNGKLIELVGALEATTNETAEIMLLSAIKQTLVRDFGAVLDHDDPLGKYQKEATLNQAQAKIDDVMFPSCGWIDWKGGECPVPVGLAVDVTHRHGKKYLKQRAGCEGLARFWDHTGSGGDIIAYRISK